MNFSVKISHAFGASPRRPAAAFTMIEIAICLAIIGFALVAVIGVLPYGMSAQRDNREETIINQDASMLLETIRSGSHGADDLTNYVYAITNVWTPYDFHGVPGATHVNGYTYVNAVLNGTPAPFYALTNGAHIVGILSTPEFTDDAGRPISDTFNVNFTSNHVYAYVRSLSGLAAEKPPQDNSIMVGNTFSYRLLSVNAPMAVDTNSPLSAFAKQMAANLHELRLTFRWPLLPNGKVADNGSSPQTFRTSISGQLIYDTNGLYFYRTQFFTNAP